MLTATDLIYEARSVHLNDPAGTIYGENALLEGINRFHRTYLYPLARKASEQINTAIHAIQFSDFTTEDSARRLRMRLPHVVRNTTLVLRTDTDPYQQIDDYKQPQGGRSTNYDPDRDFVLAAGLRYELEGSDLVIHGDLPSDFTGEVRYEHPFPDLFVGTCDSGAGLNTVPVKGATYGQLRSLEHYYRTAFLLFKSGDAAGVPVKITASAGNPIVLTVDTLPGVPAEDDPFDLISPLPVEYHSLLALGGAAQMSRLRQNQRLYALVMSGLGLELKEFVDTMEARQSDAPRHVHETQEEEWY